MAVRWVRNSYLSSNTWTPTEIKATKGCEPTTTPPEGTADGVRRLPPPRRRTVGAHHPVVEAAAVGATAAPATVPVEEEVTAEVVVAVEEGAETAVVLIAAKRDTCLASARSRGKAVAVVPGPASSAAKRATYPATVRKGAAEGVSTAAKRAICLASAPNHEPPEGEDADAEVEVAAPRLQAEVGVTRLREAEAVGVTADPQPPHRPLPRPPIPGIKDWF